MKNQSKNDAETEVAAELRSYRKMVEYKMLTIAELLVHAKKAATRLSSQEKRTFGAQSNDVVGQARQVEAEGGRGRGSTSTEGYLDNRNAASILGKQEFLYQQPMEMYWQG